jgi:hypothetical protein
VLQLSKTEQSAVQSAGPNVTATLGLALKRDLQLNNLIGQVRCCRNTYDKGEERLGFDWHAHAGADDS